jgi:lipopolysaccharide/colanic/teichoic acid biosynthesis glycosyltransferase
MQRFFDIIFTLVALIILVPLFISIMLLLRFTGEGEIFFEQNRIGENGNSFRLIKFATMVKNSPHIGTGTVTVKDDPRVLPVGRFLRSTKINELPQLLNILRGDMSIIGPRPQTERCFKAFPPQCQKEIMKVRPGLSGVGSIIFRNEEEMMKDRNDPNLFYDRIIMPFKGSLECWYVEKQSLKLYFQLIFLTAFVVLFRSSDVTNFFPKTLPTTPPELEGTNNAKRL